ncbi:MAG: hypothetical protein KatS3mg129_0313 [Leptospiraceae bacterium]|nr:MAG: hypothetical protein KatS3mg129_0313 [Leptospiraceae bacterium]
MHDHLTFLCINSEQEKELFFRITNTVYPIGIFLYREKYIYANPHFLELLGYSLEELKEKEPHEIISEKFPEKQIQKIKEIAKKRLQGYNKVHEYQEIIYKTKSGNDIYCYLFTYTIIYNNQYTGMGILININNEKLLEKEIELQKDLYHKFLNLLPFPIFLIQENDVWINQAYNHYFFENTAINTKIKKISFNNLHTKLQELIKNLQKETNIFIETLKDKSGKESLYEIHLWKHQENLIFGIVFNINEQLISQKENLLVVELLRFVANIFLHSSKLNEYNNIEDFLKELLKITRKSFLIEASYCSKCSIDKNTEQFTEIFYYDPNNELKEFQTIDINEFWNRHIQDKNYIHQKQYKKDKDLFIFKFPIDQKTIYFIFLVSKHFEYFQKEQNKLFTEVYQNLHYILNLINELQWQKILFDILSHSEEWILITDETGKIIYTNPFVEKISQYSREELINQNPRIFKSGKHKEEFYKKLWETISQKKIFTGLFINKTKYNKFSYILQKIYPYVKDEKIHYYISIGRDISKELNLEKQIQLLKNYDSITGLPNKEKFFKSINRFLKKNQGTYLIFFVIVDIREFHEVNSLLGYNNANQLLKTLGNKLTNQLLKNRAIDKEKIFLSRIGNDEFGIIKCISINPLLQPINNMVIEQIINFLNEIYSIFNQSYQINKETIYIYVIIWEFLFILYQQRIKIKQFIIFIKKQFKH